MHGDGWLSRTFLYFSQYEKGFYPEPGGVNDQPAKFPELMVTFGYIVQKVDEAKAEMEKNKPPSGKPRKR